MNSDSIPINQQLLVADLGKQFLRETENMLAQSAEQFFAERGCLLGGPIMKWTFSPKIP